MARIENLCLEVTRRCNMQCAHCLRGGAQRVDMTKEIAFTAISNFDYIDSIIFTGGEPLLNVPVISHAIDTILYRGINIGGFYIVTNGKKYSKPLMEQLMRLYNIAEEKELCGLAVSRDQYHAEFATNAVQRNLWKYEEDYERRRFPFFRTRDKNEYIGWDGRKRLGFEAAQLIPQGRAENISSRKNYQPCSEPIVREYDDCYSGLLYVTALGDLTYDCDLSYVNQKKYKVGTYDKINAFLANCPNASDDVDQVA